MSKPFLIDLARQYEPKLSGKKLSVTQYRLRIKQEDKPIENDSYHNMDGSNESNEFRQFIFNLLEAEGKLDSIFLERIKDEKSNISKKLFQELKRALTHVSADLNESNEVYSNSGDTLISKIILYYLEERFPYLFIDPIADFLLTRMGMILRDINLLQYHTAGRLTHRVSYPGKIDSLGRFKNLNNSENS